VTANYYVQKVSFDRYRDSQILKSVTL
jgi:hypothetical protein